MPSLRAERTKSIGPGQVVLCRKLVRPFNVLVRSYGDEFVGCPYQNLTLVVSGERLLGHERGKDPVGLEYCTWHREG